MAKSDKVVAENGVHHHGQDASLKCPPEHQKAIITPKVGPVLNLCEREIEVRPPGPGEVVVRIAWTGMCGSDVSFSIGPKTGFPAHDHIAGHEGIGHIVQSHDVALLHQPVALRFLAYTCERCKYCLRNLPESCRRQIAFPKDYNGTFRQYATVPYCSVAPLPPFVFDGREKDPKIYSSALCSGSAAVKATRMAGLRPGDIVVVFGIGGAIGHLVGLIARNVHRAKVIGVDVASKASHPIFDPANPGVVCDKFLSAPASADQEDSFRKRIARVCGELGAMNNRFDHTPDAVIVCSNRISSFKDLTSYICDGGSIIIVGNPSDGDRLYFPIHEILERQIKVQGCLMGSREEMYQCLEYIHSGTITPHITEVCLTDIPQYMSQIKTLSTVGKIVVRINGPIN
ncbi:GroES-like protein [Aaosphaeria arxii CBS 175.79]|uniref:alcohol dehydrogenase n=1 Tax=Aaosphaeria arxii CBS 175.79 TaxID=1450172 RepID=A0A6A5XVN4_9PLEO|nr:GroES-like protein [Aaosphaeria arxii CBS 175.79]KAF2017006.1 GroES-like protein [Aaosphaeria arxii CBS 175.79]